MRIRRRRPADDPKAEALREARRATARLRRANAMAARHRARKQGDPDESIVYTPFSGYDS